MSYGEFSLSLFSEGRPSPQEADSPVFRPSSQQPPGNRRTPRLPSTALGPPSTSPSSPLFPPPSGQFRHPPVPPPSPPSRRPRRQTAPTAAPAARPATPASAAQDSQAAREVLDRTMSRLWFERNADKHLNALKREQSAACLDSLKHFSEDVKRTEWLYPSVDELIGQY